MSSDADLTKQVPLGEVKTGLQVLGSGSAAPATAHNLSLAYDSVAAQPDAVIEGTFQFNFIQPVNDTVTGTLTFNGVQQPATYVNLAGMQSGNPNVDLSYQVDTSAMPTGRYPYTLMLSSPNMSAPATLSGAVNVVNDSAGAFGKGWDMPGLDHLYQNNVQGVPAGVLLTVGDGTGWYFTQGTGNSFTSPNGPYAFDTLTSLQGGGWQLVDKFGTKTNFNASGEQTSRVLRTGETTTDNWTGGLLTSIVDQFGRAVNLGYTSGELSSVTDYANDVWNVAHSGALLTSVTDPNPGSGSPVWQYAYSGNYLSGVTDPDNNQATYVLDAHHRISQVNLPGGGDTQATAEQSMGYGGASETNPPNVTPSSAAVATVVDALSNHTTFQTNAFGDPTESTDAYGNQTFWQRDANGLVTKLTEPPPAAGEPALVTNYTYDTLGNETSATGAHPTYGTYVFNAFSEWTSFTDSQNHQWTQSFDTNGNLKGTVDALGNSVTYAVVGSKGSGVFVWTPQRLPTPLSSDSPTP